MLAHDGKGLLPPVFPRQLHQKTVKGSHQQPKLLVENLAIPGVERDTLGLLGRGNGLARSPDATVWKPEDEGCGETGSCTKYIDLLLV